MQISNVCVLGGAGFIGCHIVHQLDAAGFRVKVLTRRRESAKHLILLPNVQVIECDVRDDAALLKHLAGAEAVINLLGILHQSGKASFSAIHAEFPRRVVAACCELGIERLLHVSALNADVNGPSVYLRSKGEGEVAVKQSNLRWTIFRPSVVFGRGDSFLTMFAQLARWMPFLFLAKPQARFQPIWVEDLAQAVAASVNEPQTIAQSYDLCGPRIYTLQALVEYAGQCGGRKPKVIGLGDRLSYWQARFMELLPVKLLTRDNLQSMSVDSVCDCEFPAVFGIKPSPLEAVAPQYLGCNSPRNGYMQFRSNAGR
ncbi:NADH dehydrogenase [Novimethylophilus kurashikiensis]|uniref:NADH dehydrogenase n=1 Tax=Novimethylophilus kurashikiensis TaxID=1825523 RepID=A0A2R5FAX2_9PROT|nr:complex I NDUFA9 subunit family protein [Novimethylophilus kurashikiensis]GBG15376.1 NADH dehydrogenase [Novimethylophilus kurashikiensis]